MNTPFWSPPSEKYPGRLPDKADVLIVGGGIAGASLLWHLGRRRINAVLVERHHLAAGASGRNAGFLLAGTASSYAAAVRTYGREKAREIWEITGENHDRLIEAVRGQDVGYRRLGSAMVPANDEERALLIESEQLLREDGFMATWDGSRLVNPRDGEVDPTALVAALARQGGPGAIREGVDVSAISPRLHDVLVTAGEEVCEAGVVVLATNGYTATLASDVKIQPVRAQMLATAPESKSIADLPAYSNFGYRYWRQLASGEVLLGGWRDTSPETEKTADGQPTDEIQERLDQAVLGLGVTSEVTHRWAGTMGFTESGLPMAGPLAGRPNTYICAGFTGHGMGFAFMSAKQVAEGI
jgi:glycine/D-amino acid oxidase-like deaminating enzyme